MSEEVAVPIKETPVENKEKVVKSAVDDGEILDEGLDLSGYLGTHGKPFVADYFGIGNFYSTNEEIAQKVDTITEYIINKTEGASLVYVAKQLLDQFSEEMNLQNEDTGLYRMKKILQMIGARTKLDLLEMMQKQAIADIETMI